VTAALTLPLGEAGDEPAALYRATGIGLRSVNGVTGYYTPTYGTLEEALSERDPAALDALARHGPLLVAVDRDADRDHRWTDFVGARSGVVRLGGDSRWAMMKLPRVDPPARAGGPAVPIVGARDERGAVDVSALTDGDPRTGWMRATPQAAGQELRVELARGARVSSIEMSLGPRADCRPRSLIVETSTDDRLWETVFAGPTSGRAFMALLDRPRDVRVEIPLRSGRARFIRLRLAADAENPWMITDLVVREDESHPPTRR
jgi:hypothetical protein